MRGVFKEKTADLERRCGGQTISRGFKTGTVGRLRYADGRFPGTLLALIHRHGRGYDEDVPPAFQLCFGHGFSARLNGTPIDYLTWGNHEDDIPHKEVLKREREYKGVWINTNMQSQPQSGPLKG